MAKINYQKMLLSRDTQILSTTAIDLSQSQNFYLFLTKFYQQRWKEHCIEVQNHTNFNTAIFLFIKKYCGVFNIDYLDDKQFVYAREQFFKLYEHFVFVLPQIMNIEENEEIIH